MTAPTSPRSTRAATRPPTSCGPHRNAPTTPRPKAASKLIDSTPDMFGLTLPDEAADRSRATMWDVIRFAEHHRYRAIIVENVVDAARWVLWDAWRTALTSLGYQHRVVYLNSMHAQAGGLPAPQSRDRLYVVAWRTGQAAPDLDRWTPPEGCVPGVRTGPGDPGVQEPTSRPWGRYRAQYVYRCPNSDLPQPDRGTRLATRVHRDRLDHPRVTASATGRNRWRRRRWTGSAPA